MRHPNILPGATHLRLTSYTKLLYLNCPLISPWPKCHRLYHLMIVRKWPRGSTWAPGASPWWDSSSPYSRWSRAVLPPSSGGASSDNVSSTVQGVGYATMTIVFWLDIYYCIIISWTLYYLFMTIINIPELPWRSCGQYVMSPWHLSTLYIKGVIYTSFIVVKDNLLIGWYT